MATATKVNGSSAPETFETKVTALMLAGVSKDQAVRRVALKFPDLREDWIKRFNDATPAERKALELPRVRGNLIEFADGTLQPIGADASSGMKSPAFGAMVDNGVNPYRAAEMTGDRKRYI